MAKEIGSKWWFNPKAAGYDQGYQAGAAKIVATVAEAERQLTVARKNPDGSAIVIPPRDYVVVLDLPLTGHGLAPQLFASEASLTALPGA